MSNSKKYFGTDGIRGSIGSPIFGPELILKLGWAYGSHLRAKHQLVTANDNTQSKRLFVIIGKDTRVSGYMFESALQSGLIAAGIDVVLTGPMPTPAIAYLTKTLNSDGGIVISASHNPHSDNGIKFFNANGEKLTDADEFDIEKCLTQKLVSCTSADLGRADRLNSANGRYIEFCKSRCSQSLQGFKIVIDCSNGATYAVAPFVFRELGADVEVICNHPDGLNINHECGSTNLTLLRSTVLATQADCGIAFDGDGDRLMMVDHTGAVVDGDQILYIIATSQAKLPQAVVGTILSNIGLEISLKEKGIDFLRAEVGDKSVMEMLRTKKLHFGAEPSGHILSLKRTTTGDGIIAALQVLEAMVTTVASLHDLSLAMKKVPQVTYSVEVADKSIINSKPFKLLAEKVKHELGKNSRMIIRSSGTENKIRIMIECDNAVKINALAKKLSDKLLSLS